MKPKVRARDLAAESVGRTSRANDCLPIAGWSKSISASTGSRGRKAEIRRSLLESDANRLEHADEAARRVENLKADLIDRLHEGAELPSMIGPRAVDLDDRIVHAQSAQRGQHMLRSRNQGTRRVPIRGKFSRRDRTDPGADFAVAPIAHAERMNLKPVLPRGVQGQGDGQAE